MPYYLYRCRSREGALIKGRIEAQDDAVVALNLRNLGYSIIHITKESPFRQNLENLWQRLRGIPRQDVVFFTRQLAALLAAGISLREGLSALELQIKNLKFRQIIKGTREDIEKGTSLSNALSKYPEVFNELYISMIKVSESAGILDKVLERLSQLGTQDLELRSRLRVAFSYPLILVFLSIIVVGILVALVVPKFIVVFNTYGQRLPLTTRMLLWIAQSLKYLLFFGIFFIGAGIWWLRNYLKTPSGRLSFDRFILRIPLLGDFLLKVSLAQFSRTLSNLLSAGVPILEALLVSSRTIKNNLINRVINDLRLSISQGNTLSEPLVASGIFPAMVIQMIASGERTGKLDQMLLEVSRFYEQETELTMRNISSILEPVLLLIMGGVVAFIALSILLPIFNLVKVFRH